MKLVITGIGVLSPAGPGLEAFGNAVIGRNSAIGPVERFGSGRVAGAEIKGFDFSALFKDRRFRRASDVTQYVLVAASEAVSMAGFGAGEKGFCAEKTAVVAGMTHASLNMSCEFHAGLVADGPLGASPALFSDSVLNAATGAVSLAFGLKGPTHTLIGGAPVGLQALAFGAELVRGRMAASALVVSGEALSERAVEAYSRLYPGREGTGRGPGGPPSGFVPGEGAAALMVETLEGAQGRGIEPVAYLAGWGVSSGPVLEESVREAAACALRMAGLDGEEIEGAVVSGGPGGGEGRALGGVLKEGTPVLSLGPLFADAFSATALMGAAAAEVLMYCGLPASSVGPGGVAIEWSWAGKGPGHKAPAHVLVSSTGLLGEAAAIVLKRT